MPFCPRPHEASAFSFLRDFSGKGPCRDWGGGRENHSAAAPEERLVFQGIRFCLCIEGLFIRTEGYLVVGPPCGRRWIGRHVLRFAPRQTPFDAGALFCGTGTSAGMSRRGHRSLSRKIAIQPTVSNATRRGQCRSRCFPLQV